MKRETNITSFYNLFASSSPWTPITMLHLPRGGSFTDAHVPLSQAPQADGGQGEGGAEGGEGGERREGYDTGGKSPRISGDI